MAIDDPLQLLFGTQSNVRRAKELHSRTRFAPVGGRTRPTIGTSRCASHRQRADTFLLAQSEDSKRGSRSGDHPLFVIRPTLPSATLARSPPPFLQHSRLPVDRRPNDARKDEPSALQGPFVSRSANFGRLDPRRGLWVTDITPRPPPTEAHPECRTLRTKSAKFRPRARCRVVVVLARFLLATTAETSWHQVQS